MDFNTFLMEVDTTVKLVVEREFPGDRCVGGKYVQETHTIFLYERDIAIQCENIFGSLEHLEQYRWIVFSHELGHARDEELPGLSEELDRTGDRAILYRIEQNAWRIAAQLIPFIDETLFNKVKAESLAHNYRQLELIS